MARDSGEVLRRAIEILSSMNHVYTRILKNAKERRNTIINKPVLNEIDRIELVGLNTLIDYIEEVLKPGILRAPLLRKHTGPAAAD